MYASGVARALGLETDPAHVPVPGTVVEHELPGRAGLQRGHELVAVAADMIPAPVDCADVGAEPGGPPAPAVPSLQRVLELLVGGEVQQAAAQVPAELVKFVVVQFLPSVLVRVIAGVSAAVLQVQRETKLFANSLQFSRAFILSRGLVRLCALFIVVFC